MSVRRACPVLCTVVLCALWGCSEADGPGAGPDGPQVLPQRVEVPPEPDLPVDPLAEVEAYELAPGQSLDVVEVRSEDGSLKLRRGVLRDADGMVNHGHFQRWHANGQLAEDGHYLAGQRHGRYAVVAESGLKETEVEYRRGVKHGESLAFTKGGQIKERAHYVDGVLHGPFEGRVAQLRVSGTYDHGVEVGLWTWSDFDGNKQREGELAGGVKVGLWRSWHPGDVLASEEPYVDGQLEGVVVEYDENGVRRAERTYVAGQLQGESREYYPSGKPSASIHYTEGVPDGPQTRWYEDGVVQMQGTMSRGKRSGAWVYNGPDGTRNEAWSGTYEADVRVGD